MIAFSGVGLTLILLLATIGNLAVEYRESEHAAERHAGNLVRLLAAQTDAVTAAIDQSTLRVIDAIGKRPLEALATDDSFRKLLVELCDHVPYLRSIRIINARGEIVQTSHENIEALFDAQNQEYFTFQRDRFDGGLFIQPPLNGQIILTRRINTVDGGFSGIVVAVLNGNYLQKLFNSIDVGHFGIISLLLHDGRLLVRTPHDPTLFGKSMVTTGLQHDVHKEACVGDDRLCIAAYESIESGRMILRVAVDNDEILAEWRQSALLHTLGVLAFVGLLALLTHLMRVQLRRCEYAEAAQRESQRLAVSTIDALTVQLCVLDETGTIIVVNRAWQEAAQTPGIEGMTKARVGTNYLAVCDAVTASLADGIRAVMAGTIHEHIREYPCPAPGGERWYVVRVTRFASSGPVRVVVVHRDITYRRHAALELIREKERTQTYLAISESIIIELDAAGRIRRINPRGCDVLGQNEEALIGREWFEHLSSPAAQKAARTRHRQIILGQAKIVPHYENEVVGHGGRRLIIAWHATVLTASDGRITGTLSSGQDVTERRRTEDNLRESERRLAKAQAIARLGNWEADLLSGVVWWSNEIHKIFGRGPLEFAAGFADYLRFVAPDDQPSLHEQERRLVADGTPINVDHRIIRPDGSVRFVNLQADIITDADGVARRTVGIVHDITERKQIEMELLHAVQQAAIASRTKTEFLANISHELNTPLNAVIGFSEIIAEDLCGPSGNPKYQEFGHIIYESGRHLQQIITDIIDLTKIDAGELELDDDLILISEVVVERLRVLTKAIETGGLTLVPVVIEPRLGLRGDRRTIKQILHNLLSNAVKFTPPGRTVSLTARQATDGRLCFTIVDTGVGMATEDIPRALDRFSQIDGSLARQHDGTGLGLSLAKLLVERHGGTIDIISAVGSGTTVQVWFPQERVLDLEVEAVPATRDNSNL